MRRSLKRTPETTSRQLNAVTHDAASAPPQRRPQQPEHLVVLCNGLFGSADNWRVVVEQLRGAVDADATLLLTSAVNSRCV